MTLPIALQTYSVRELLADDFEGIMRAIAEMGYAGLEPTFNIPGATLEQAKRLFTELGFQIPAAHVPLPLGDEKQAVLEYAELFGLNTIVSGKGSGDFQTIDSIKRVCGLFNQAHDVCAANSLNLAYHNHWWEFEDVEGVSAFDVMLEHLNPDIGFEVDIYWVQAAGIDPKTVIERLGDRAPLLHVKDGPAQRGVPQTALGEGVVDLPDAIGSAKSASWLIVELDECATDMMEAVAQSYRYLVGVGLGHGA